MAHFRLAADMRILEAQLSEALRCPTCGKRSSVANTAGYRQRFAAERVTLETHCSCLGGPAEHLTRTCQTCGDYGEIADPSRPLATNAEDALLLGPPTIPCPDCDGGSR